MIKIHIIRLFQNIDDINIFDNSIIMWKTEFLL